MKGLLITLFLAFFIAGKSYHTKLESLSSLYEKNAILEKVCNLIFYKFRLITKKCWLNIKQNSVRFVFFSEFFNKNQNKFGKKDSNLKTKNLRSPLNY